MEEDWLCGVRKVREGEEDIKRFSDVFSQRILEDD